MADNKDIKEVVDLNSANNGASVYISNEPAQSKPYLGGEFDVHDALQAALPGQVQARELLTTLPFPGNKDEPWRKTSLRDLPLAELSLASNTRVDLENAPEGVVFLPLAEALRSHAALLNEKLNQLVLADTDKFSALAAGYAQNGFLLYVPPNTRVAQDLKAVIHVRENGSIQNSQVLIVVDRGADVTLHLELTGTDDIKPALHSGIVEVYVEDNARLHLVETQELARKTWHFSHEKAAVGANAQLEWVYFAFGSKLSKSFLNVALTGKGAEAHLNGLSITNSGQHLDLDTQQDHMAPITTSNLNFKAALLGKSRTVWQGMIYVDPAAYQTDGYQTSRNLLLDNRAHADAIPGLEIKTDDVRCSHGATISHVDDEMIFYLKSRGLDEITARDLIVNGFFEEIVDRVRDEDTRAHLRERISAKLAEVD